MQTLMQTLIKTIIQTMLHATAPLQATAPISPVQNPLSELRDIHLPEPVSLWPITLGWWILAIVILTTAYVSIRWYTRRRKKQAYKREALRHLDKLEIKYMRNANHHQLLNDLSELMRRVCLTAYPRKQVAGLIGSKWLAFLDTQGNTSKFSSGIGLALIEQRFAPSNTQARIPVKSQDPSHEGSYEMADLILICRKWITSQK